MTYFTSDEMFETYDESYTCETEETYEYYTVAPDTQSAQDYTQDYTQEPTDVDYPSEPSYEESDDTCEYDPNDGGEYIPPSDDPSDSDMIDYVYSDEE